ncbi:MAG TPA: GNAT family N-acetyltransferase [Caldithrix sp.]|nr:GNAT family N-acetyltransferase [Calditrichaceae bacterium]HEM48904.1 GNAT family N-acetyltransferase [Caldithrix sp.]HES59611.1 GNAT family N-acetyltransferase [Caldithrix sp.]
MSTNSIYFRTATHQEDEKNIRDIVTSTGFFNQEEIDIAVELLTENLQKGGEVSGYHFIFAEINEQTVGYACFGPIPATKFSYDLYWIAVHENSRGMGIGKKLLIESEKAIKNLGGQRIYIETSSRAQYNPTRAFYISSHYETAAILKDFYAPGDSKYIFLKIV